MFDLFGILATPLGYAMRWLYMLVGNYGWAIIIFTFLVRLLMFPLSLKQQKSTARMQAYQPMIQEIQKKWANDRNRQNQEMQKFYEENNIKMSAGCAPMLVNMLVLFGIIAVIQAPLGHILRIDNSEINVGYSIIQQYDADSGIEKNSSSYTRQSTLIGAIKNEESRHWFVDGAELPYYDGQVYVLTEGQTVKDGILYDSKGNQVMNGEEPVKFDYMQTSMNETAINDITNFNFKFLGLNLAEAPQFSLDKWYTLIFPVLSLLTMVASQLIIMKSSGQQQGRNQMLIMTVLFGALFAFYAFRVPAGFSLYYTISNVVMTIQQIVVKNIHDPEKIREEIAAEIEAKKAAKKAKKKVVVKDSSGEVVSREVSEAELAKIRLAKARELDAKRYNDDDGGGQDEDEETEATKKARELDEKKYGKIEPSDPSEDTDEEDGGEETAQTADAPADEPKKEEKNTPKSEYKPGRRARARKGKEEKDDSFAQQERAAEEVGSKEDE